MTNDQMREAFEAWAPRAGLNTRRAASGAYSSAETQAAWVGWSGAAPRFYAAGMERAAGICDARKTENWGLTEAEHEAGECADAIRAQIPKEKNDVR